MSDGNRGFSIYQLQFLWVWSFGARDERRGNQSLLLHQHRVSLITPLMKQTKILRRQRRMITIQAFSQIMILGTLKVRSTLEYKRTKMHRWMITTFMSMSTRNLLLQGRLLLRLTVHMRGNELFTFNRITRSLFNFHRDFALEHAWLARFFSPRVISAVTWLISVNGLLQGHTETGLPSFTAKSHWHSLLVIHRTFQVFSK